MKFFYNYSMIFSAVLMATCLSSGAQTELFDERLAQNEAERIQLLREKKEHDDRVCLERKAESKRIFEQTGNGAGCDFTGEHLDDIIAELNKKKIPIDLSGANLTGATLIGVSLKNANLTNANLTETSFYKSDLRLADLTAARLTGTNFGEANLTYARLHDVSMDKFDITLNLKDTNIEGVRVSSDFFGMKLRLLHRANNMFLQKKP